MIKFLIQNSKLKKREKIYCLDFQKSNLCKHYNLQSGTIPPIKNSATFLKISRHFHVSILKYPGLKCKKATPPSPTLWWEFN